MSDLTMEILKLNVFLGLFGIFISMLVVVAMITTISSVYIIYSWIMVQLKRENSFAHIPAYLMSRIRTRRLLSGGRVLSNRVWGKGKVL